MTAWVLVGGRFVPSADVERVRREWPPSFIAAADGGIDHALPLGVRPHLWVGDFDSSDPADPRWQDIERVAYPCDKDELDAELALRAAHDRGARRFVLWGAFGGRFDHTLALATIAINWAERGNDMLLHSGDESAVPFLGGKPLELDVEPGQTISVLALATLESAYFEGVRWPLCGDTVTPGTVRTMSNEATSRRVRLTATRGRGLVVLQHAT